MTRTAVAAAGARMEHWVLATGRVFAALNVILIAVILLQIFLRHAFAGGHQVALGELEWHLYAAAMLFGLPYAQAADSHVRVDALARRWTPRRRAAIEMFGIVFLFMPFIVVVFLHGLDYVADSWRVSERSDSPVGLPFRWLIKSLIPASFALWFFALLARLMKDAAFFLGTGPAAGGRP